MAAFLVVFGPNNQNLGAPANGDFEVSRATGIHTELAEMAPRHPIVWDYSQRY